MAAPENLKPGSVISYRLRTMTAGDPDRRGAVEQVLPSGTIVLSDETYLRPADLASLSVVSPKFASDHVSDDERASAPTTSQEAAAAPGLVVTPSGVSSAPAAAKPARKLSAESLQRIREGFAKGSQLGVKAAREAAAEAKPARLALMRRYYDLRRSGTSNAAALAAVNAEMPAEIAAARIQGGGFRQSHLGYWSELYRDQIGDHTDTRKPSFPTASPRPAAAPAGEERAEALTTSQAPAPAGEERAEALTTSQETAAAPGFVVTPSGVSSAPAPAASSVAAANLPLLDCANRLRRFALRLEAAAESVLRAERALAILDAYPQGEE